MGALFSKKLSMGGTNFLGQIYGGGGGGGGGGGVVLHGV